MIKVGDRVRVYDFGCEADNEIWDGKVLEISKYQDIIVKVSNGDDDFWVFSKQCRKLIKRNKPNFKVGDRVHAVLKDLNLDIKGKLMDIDTINGISYYRIDSDKNEGWFKEDTIKRLVKKKVEFKVGDRVSAGGQKGTIKQFHAKSDLAYVKFDNVDNSFIMAHPIDEFKKLRKKKTEFKVGDRVSAKGIFASYGTIKSIDNRETLLYVHLDDYDRNIHFYPRDCKKLVKKKKEPHYTTSDIIRHAWESLHHKPEIKFTYSGGDKSDIVMDNLNKWNEFFEKNSYKVVRQILNDIDKRLSMLEGFQ